MSTLPQRQYGVFITIALAVIGAVVAGVVLFTSGKASDVDLTTAAFVPDDVGFYVAINTDLSSSQWVNTFKLLERLGRDDPEQELMDAVTENGELNWEDDVVPFLGGNAAVFFRSANLLEGEFEGAAVIRCKDSKRALQVALDQSAADVTEGEYAGVAYFQDAQSGAVLARMGDHLVVASSEDVFREVVDVQAGRSPSLAKVAEFRSLRDELSKNFLAFMYVSPGDLAESIFGEAPELRQALEEAGAGDLAFKPSALVVAARDAGFEFHHAALGRPGVVAPLVQPRESRFARLAAADSAIFASTAGISKAWDEVVRSAEDEIDDAIAREGAYTSLDDALRALGDEAGIDSIEQLIDLFAGETAVAFAFPRGNTEDAEFVVFAEVKHEAGARDLLKRVLSKERPRALSEQVNGVEMVILESGDREPLAYGLRDGYLALGDVSRVRHVLAGDAPTLAGSDGYKASLAQLDTRLGSFAYFDLAAILGLREAGLPPELDEATRALRGLIINIVDERDVIRFSGAVGIEE
ncbi:MAG: DUF3352 domain-containing protein [Chloroflexota bacterium]